jgi:CBS domain-containing protein
MNVTRLYSRNVIAVPQATTLQDAARIMATQHVGSLIVTDNPPHDERALGIVTDRDFVVQAMTAGADPRDTTVAEVMTTNLARIPETADVHRALEAMVNVGIRRLAVVNESGEILGVLSFGDLVDGIAVEMADLARIIRKERTRETALTTPAQQPATATI